MTASPLHPPPVPGRLDRRGRRRDDRSAARAGRRPAAAQRDGHRRADRRRPARLGLASDGPEQPAMLAVCDIDDRHIAKGLKSEHAHPEAKGYKDFRHVMDRKDIDVVCIATPPHWHALMCIAAAQAGKDIFCEKPMTKFIAEGRAVADAVAEHKVDLPDRHLRPVRQSTANSQALRQRPGEGVGRRGSGHRAAAGRADRSVGRHARAAGTGLRHVARAGAFKPYHPHRVHYSNRFYWDYEGGDLTNFGHHRIDPFAYEYAKDDTGPVEIEPTASGRSTPTPSAPGAGSS
jgi:myo-inositol 2-dehydrogenase / D-chiro-inositol 1-dehydrogenase